MESIYPVQAYLHMITNLLCGEGVKETLTHLACVCPKFREASTSAHNQVRRVVTVILTSTTGRKWQMIEETRMKNMLQFLEPGTQPLLA
jgi:hypothetical protein